MTSMSGKIGSWRGWRWLRVTIAVAIVGILANCYVPARFDAEIEISRTGNYTLTYEGLTGPHRVVQLQC